VLSNFVAVALNPREQHGADERAGASAAAVAEVEEAPAPAPSRRATVHVEPEPEPSEEPLPEAAVEIPVHVAPIDEPEVAEAAPVEAEVAESSAFDVASLSDELKDLHRRANRVAKVAMPDIKLLTPKDVRLGRENKDICNRLRSELDKARKEYDRRFRAIQDHPVDYFHHWLVEILAEGDSQALGDYPYPSPVLRH